MNNKDIWKINKNNSGKNNDIIYALKDTAGIITDVAKNVLTKGLGNSNKLLTITISF